MFLHFSLYFNLLHWLMGSKTDHSLALLTIYSNARKNSSHCGYVICYQQQHAAKNPPFARHTDTNTHEKQGVFGPPTISVDSDDYCRFLRISRRIFDNHMENFLIF